MCSLCGYSTCPGSCPNAPDPVGVYECEYCNSSIAVGDEYVEIEDNRYHRECFEGLSLNELLEIVGGSLKQAEEDDIDDGSDWAYECKRDEELFGD